LSAKFILRPDWSAKFILRPDWSAKFILRPDWSAKFILRLCSWNAKFIFAKVQLIMSLFLGMRPDRICIPTWYKCTLFNRETLYQDFK